MSERFDAVLVHGYRFPYRGAGSYIGNRNRLQAVAAERLLRDNKTDTLVIAGGHWFGRNAPPFAEIFSTELTRRGVAESVITINKGHSTSTELDLFQQQADTNGWSSVATLATSDHRVRVMLLRDRHMPQAASLASEDIARAAQEDIALSPDVRQEAHELVHFFSNPHNTLAFNKKEKTLLTLTKLHLDGALTVVQRTPGVRQLQNIIDQ